MKITCEKFREHQKNSLEGFADLVIEDIGLRLHDCTLHRSGDSEWISPPARPYEDEEGTKRWARLIDFRTRTAFYEFQEAAKEAIRAFRERGANARKN